MTTFFVISCFCVIFNLGGFGFGDENGENKASGSAISVVTLHIWMPSLLQIFRKYMLS